MVVLYGKSGSGKTAIQFKLLENGFVPVLQYTTRPIRDGETVDKEYHFVSNEKFDLLDSNNEFIESSAFTLANGLVVKYGTPVKEVVNNIKNGVLILNPKAMRPFINYCKKHGLLKDIYVCEITCDDETLLARAINRGDDKAECLRRIGADEKDMRKYKCSEIRNLSVKSDTYNSIDQITAFIVKQYGEWREKT